MKIVEEKLELKQKEDQERLEKEQKLAKLREKVNFFVWQFITYSTLTVCLLCVLS